MIKKRLTNRAFISYNTNNSICYYDNMVALHSDKVFSEMVLDSII